jgi:2-polyprenyl-6-methoxyphenol hydroxylase-like FAD-dependent oxidoreductase
VRRLNILISGAGIAGCTLAYWVARLGHAATVVERGGALRSSGAPVDVRGPAALVADRMQITARLRAAATRLTGLTFLDRTGRQSARVDLEGVRRSIAPGDIELPRGDLAMILHAASRDGAEFIFDDSIASLAQDDAGVDVTFRRSAPRRFDLVVGADGLHSIVRRLAFGADADFVHHGGLYVATVPLPHSLDFGRDIVMLNAPGKAVTLHPGRDSPLAALFFWSPEIAGLDHFDTARHKEIVDATFGDLGWKVPDVLAAVRASSDLYFDAVSRVAVADWARGRIALLGDASSCVSLVGDGSTLAIAGACTLAEALAEHPEDHHAAFRSYQSTHGRLVTPRQRNMSLMASLIVPRTQTGIALRNQVLVRLLVGGAAVARIARRRRD